MDNREIAKELAVACLGHEVVAAYFRPGSMEKASAVDAGEKLEPSIIVSGKHYNRSL